MLPLVSVVVPVYKTFDYLNECMDSLINQTYTNIEIILVDDGSPDASPKLCDFYEKTDNRVRVIHKKNGGLSSARNAGIAVARGDYITFVDSDDIVSNDIIKTMVDIALKENASIVKIGLKRFTSPPKDLEPLDFSYQIFSSKTALDQIYIGLPQVISACGKLFRKELFENIKFPEGYNHEDEYTIPKLFLVATKIVFCESVLYYYMQRENDSIMRASFSSVKLDIIYVMEERIDFFDKAGFADLKQKAIMDFYIHLHRLKKSAQDSKCVNEQKIIEDKLKKGRKNELSFFNRIKLRYIIFSSFGGNYGS